ncbi:MAG: phosphatidylserine decarboxylase [Candidatus Altiarchaeota archaeon]
MIRFRECWPLIAILAALTLAGYVIFLPSALIFSMLLLFTLYFFRDPERRVPSGAGLLVSPADGRVLDVEEVNDSFVGSGRRLSIFMSAFDVHVNRSPFGGTVKSVRHTPGKKVVAYLKGELSARERNRIEMSGGFNIAVEQYAGIFARRIVCYVRGGQSVAAGERIGMIKFGSRVDVVMPLNVEVKVRKGERVTAGETVIGVVNG